MATIRTFITKFGREVLIDEDHPLAVAEKNKGSVVTADQHSATAPAASLPADPVPPKRPRGRPRKN